MREQRWRRSLQSCNSSFLIATDNANLLSLDALARARARSNFIIGFSPFCSNTFGCISDTNILNIRKYSKVPELSSSIVHCICASRGIASSSLPPAGANNIPSGKFIARARVARSMRWLPSVREMTVRISSNFAALRARVRNFAAYIVSGREILPLRVYIINTVNCTIVQSNHAFYLYYMMLYYENYSPFVAMEFLFICAKNI